MKKIPFTFKYNVKPGERNLPKEVKEKLFSYPLIPVRFYFKAKKTPIFEALLDSGADGIYIHKAIAENLNLQKGIKIESGGMGGKYMCYETEVGLILGRGGREVDFGVTKAVYPESDLDVPLLIGRIPLFEEYQVIFEEFKKQVKLIPKEDILKKKL